MRMTNLGRDREIAVNMNRRHLKIRVSNFGSRFQFSVSSCRISGFSVPISMFNFVFRVSNFGFRFSVFRFRFSVFVSPTNLTAGKKHVRVQIWKRQNHRNLYESENLGNLGVEFQFQSPVCGFQFLYFNSGVMRQV